MATVADKIQNVLKDRNGLSDREIAEAIYGKGKPQQLVYGDCRLLAQKGLTIRQKREDGITGNYISGTQPREPVSNKDHTPDNAEIHAEDFVKQRIAAWLTESGWQPEVKWGRDRGIDIHAKKGKERWVIEVKGIGKYQPMRVNFFLGALAELLQRMDDPDAQYSVAFPDIPQYRGLWNRLPALAKKRTSISALFISEDGTVDVAN